MSSPRLVKFYRRDVRGNIAILTALSALALLICAGAAIDYYRLVQARTALQGMLDSATLAAAAQKGPADKAGTRHLKFNAASPPAVVTAASFSRRSDGTVDGVLKAELQASFLRLAGFRQLGLTVSSAARAKSAPSSTILSIKTVSGRTPYDKELYAVITGKDGKTVSETLVQSYDYTCLCHSEGKPVFTPAVGTAVSVTVGAEQSVIYKLVVYRDPTKTGVRWQPTSLLSSSSVAAAHLKLSGQCADLGGQTQNWEDGLSLDYTSLVVNVTCTALPSSGKPTVTLVR